MTPVADSERFMRRALTLARRGRGRVSPNPLVGALVVRDGQVVGEGTHYYDQVDHAEVVALRAAGEAARGADLYVNLEPCAHQGRTPPCADEIAAAGIRRVYFGVADPSPTAGGGAKCLRDQGVDVQSGLLEDRCRHLNEVFLCFATTDRPFVLLKLGLTLDGRIAGPHGNSRWITGEKARRWVHQLRFDYDAILVGVGTILADNPSLDVRGTRRNSIHKVILDSNLRTPEAAQVFTSDDPVTVFHAVGAAASRRKRLERRARLVEVAHDAAGLDWDAVLAGLATAPTTSLLVEGGGQVAASALKAGVVDKLAFFYGSKIVGDSGVAGVADLGLASLAESLELKKLRCRKVGSDVLIEGYPTK